MSPTFAPTHDVYCVSCKLSSAMCPYGMRSLGGIWYCYGCLPSVGRVSGDAGGGEQK